MKQKSYLIFAYILLAGSVLFQNCKDEKLDNCKKEYTLNQGNLDKLLFDYEHTDTLRYKRIVNDVVFDTLVFVKKRRYRDTLEFNNRDASVREDCAAGTKIFTRERIGWDYKSQYDSIKFNIQVVAVGKGGTGNDDFLISISKNFNLSYPLGSGIGNYGLSPENPYITSEKIYDYTWWTLLWNQTTFTSYGEKDDKYRIQLDWKCFYNIKFGYVRIAKNDHSIVWDLIP